MRYRLQPYKRRQPSGALPCRGCSGLSALQRWSPGRDCRLRGCAAGKAGPLPCPASGDCARQLALASVQPCGVGPWMHSGGCSGIFGAKIFATEIGFDSQIGRVLRLKGERRSIRTALRRNLAYARTNIHTLGISSESNAARATTQAHPSGVDGVCLQIGPRRMCQEPRIARREWRLHTRAPCASVVCIRTTSR